MSEEIKLKSFKRANFHGGGKLSNSVLISNPHYTMPGINLIRNDPSLSWDLDSVSKMFEDYPYSCDLPKPLLPPLKLNREVLADEDPSLQLITTKSHMNDDIERLRNYYEKYHKVLKLPKKKNVKWMKSNNINSTTLPRHIANIAEIIELDPDPYFSGAYNWYYTGGTLSNICYQEDNILLFPYSQELIASPISLQEKSLYKAQLQNAAKCSLDHVLYELRHNVINNFCRISGRFKNHCIIYNLSRSKDQLQLIEFHKQPSPFPYVSADLSPFNLNEYCTADVKRLITKWDLTKVKPINSGTVMNIKSLDDNWGSIKYDSINPDILIYTDRCCIHYIDTREPIERPSLSLCPKAQLEVCEGLCFDCPSSNFFCRYIGTYHNFLLCDNRSPNQCTQQKWTHHFKSAPLLCSVLNKESRETIVLASQIPRENSIILNNWIHENFSRSYSFPFTPPSILETLQQSQLHGKCLNPLLKPRLELCNVGCTLTTNNEGHTYLFLQNSIGDIFYQGIMYNDILDMSSLENRNAISDLESWENSILKQHSTIVPLTFSEKSNMSHIFKNLKKTRLKISRPDKLETFSDPCWKQSLSKLNSYVDILAPELLSIWEIDENAAPPLTTAPHQKVLNWLETSEIKKDLVCQSQDMESELTPVNTQELISVSQQHNLVLFEESDIQQLYLPTIKSKAKPKPKEAKKRKYVPGF